MHVCAAHAQALPLFYGVRGFRTIFFGSMRTYMWVNWLVIGAYILIFAPLWFLLGYRRISKNMQEQARKEKSKSELQQQQARSAAESQQAQCQKCGATGGAGLGAVKGSGGERDERDKKESRDESAHARAHEGHLGAVSSQPGGVVGHPVLGF